MVVAITRAEHGAVGLRQAATRARDADASRRTLALALVLDGRSRSDAAQSCSMDRQTLRDGLHRFDEQAWLACPTARHPALRRG